MSKVKQIIRLKENGIGLRTISRSLGISRNTVKKYLQLIETRGYSVKELLTKDDEALEQLFSSPDQTSTARHEQMVKMFPYIEQELKRTGVTRWILWGEYKEEYPDGYSYPHFCVALRQWMGTRGATMHFDHTPADKMFIDFIGKKLHLVDRKTGEVTEVEVYVGGSTS